MNKIPSFTKEDYPGLYQAANSESIRAQKAFFRCFRWFLSLLILGAIVSLFSGDSKLYALFAALVFIGSLSLFVFIEVKRYDRTWYSARAVAESVKTRVWRYMMRAEPYLGDITDAEIRKIFLSDLQEILEENSHVTKELCDESATINAITEQMETIRALNMSDRIIFYKNNRVEEQGGWYQRKAAENKKKGIHWFIGIVALNGIAIVCALFRIAYTSWSYLPTEIFAVAAASGVSWLQAKRFSELSTSYALAAHEIAIIQSRLPTVSREEEVSKFVSDTENAFSREHTQWAARRDTRCRTSSFSGSQKIAR